MVPPSPVVIAFGTPFQLGWGTHMQQFKWQNTGITYLLARDAGNFHSQKSYNKEILPVSNYQNHFNYKTPRN